MRIIDSQAYSQDDGSPFIGEDGELTFTGQGENAAEAYADAVETAKEQGVLYQFPKHPAGIRQSDKLSQMDLDDGMMWTVVIAIPQMLAA